MTQQLKKVPLNQLHEEELKAKMVEFAGFWMPVRYSSDKDEHMTVRQAVGVFDVSHMGEFFITGDKALELIQYVSANDASTLPIGKAQYSYFPNGKGGIVDDLLVYHLGEKEYMMVVNAANIEKDWQWIQTQNQNIGATLTNRSDEFCLFAVQGPYAANTLQKLTETALADMPYYAITRTTFAGIPNIMLASTGYTKKGSGSFEVFVPQAEAYQVWKKIFEAGAEWGIKPIGLGARDTLRLEMGYCLYGNDITDHTSPIEAGLGWVTKFTKNFIDADLFKKQKEEGISKKLVAFRMVEKGIPRSHYPICDANGNTIGEVTSGTISPVLNIGIGMGYVNTTHNALNTEVFVKIREQLHKAIIVKPPFVD
ncbi:MAG: glycine cleavage system aminomethyltransferase GcvT [Cytophagales bacterium]|nr:MAG: glycine cleavage system aminomethyltransferase GcvT [Cytophagales bacterium]